MARYIDADAVHEKYDRYANHSPFVRGHGKMLAGFLDWIDEEPTSDVVKVVWCKDCKWYDRYEVKSDGTPDKRYKPNFCYLYKRHHKEAFFCADGERRTE